MNRFFFSFRFVGALAFAFLFTFSTPALADGMTFDEDTDRDGVPDSAEPEGCVESSPVGTDSRLIDPNTGCFRSTEGCVAWRSQNGGNSLDCAGTPRWSGEYLEVMRGVSMRQRSDGTLISVSGNSVSRRGDALVCSEPSSYLYADGKGQAPGGEVFDSAIGANQLPFCSSHRYDSVQAVAATRSGVSQSDVDASIGRATSGWEAQMGAVEGRLNGIESTANAASTEAARAHTRLDTVEGHFAPGGRVAKLEAHFSDDEDSFASRTAAAIAQILGLAQEAHRMATAAREVRPTLRGGVVVNTLNLEDGKVHGSSFQRHVDPSMGWRVLEGGISLLKGGDRFHLDVVGFADLFGYGNYENGMALGLGLGVSVQAAGMFVVKPAFAMGVGGGIEAQLRLHNLARDMYVRSETGTFTPNLGLVILCGEGRSFITMIKVNPAGNLVNWSDGTYLATGIPTLSASVTVGARF